MLIERLRSQPILQIIWSVIILTILLVVYPNEEGLQLSPFLPPNFFEFANGWIKPIFFLSSFGLLFASLFRLSSLLRNFSFTGDSRFDMLFFLLPIMLLFPELLIRLDLALFIFLLQSSLKLQFEIHTQVSIRKEIALMGFYMSLASIFYPLALLVAILLYVGILLQRGFYLRELLIYLICLGLPFYFIASLIYLLDLPFLYSLELNYTLPELPGFSLHTLIRSLFLLVVSFLLLKSIGINSKSILRSKAQFRNFYLLLLLGISISLFMNTAEGFAIAFLSLFAIFSVSQPKVTRNWIIELLLILLSIAEIIQIFTIS